MVVSWLTPINNHGVFMMAINKQRHSLSLILARRSFCLSPALRGMESMLLAIGRCHGHLRDKFAEIEGLIAEPIDGQPAKSGAKPKGNSFALLAPEDSDAEAQDDGAAASAPVAPLGEFGVSGAAAHLECKVLATADSVEGDANDEEPEPPHHCIITARIVRAYASPSHWNGKQFGANSPEAPPCLSFLGSETFADVILPAANADAAVAADTEVATAGDCLEG